MEIQEYAISQYDHEIHNNIKDVECRVELVPYGVRMLVTFKDSKVTEVEIDEMTANLPQTTLDKFPVYLKYGTLELFATRNESQMFLKSFDWRCKLSELKENVQKELFGKGEGITFVVGQVENDLPVIKTEKYKNKEVKIIEHQGGLKGSYLYDYLHYIQHTKKIYVEFFDIWVEGTHEWYRVKAQSRQFLYPSGLK